MIRLHALLVAVAIALSFWAGWSWRGDRAEGAEARQQAGASAAVVEQVNKARVTEHTRPTPWPSSELSMKKTALRPRPSLLLLWLSCVLALSGCATTSPPATPVACTWPHHTPFRRPKPSHRVHPDGRGRPIATAGRGIALYRRWPCQGNLCSPDPGAVGSSARVLGARAAPSRRIHNTLRLKPASACFSYPSLSRYRGESMSDDYKDPISLMVHSTVRIQCEDADGRASSGTGYIYLFCDDGAKSVPCVVTNKHVIDGKVRGVFHMTLRGPDGGPMLGSHEAVIVEHLEASCIRHPDPSVDLAVLPIATVINAANLRGGDYFFVPLTHDLIPTQSFLDSLSALENIVMIGYPTGLWDQVHNLPIVRKGITATHPRLPLNGKSEFLIDAACFPGSSGSPVFLADVGSYASRGGIVVGTRIILLGTLYAGPVLTTEGEIVVIDVPTESRQVARGHIPTNLGYVVSSSRLTEMEDLVRVWATPPLSRNSPCPCGKRARFKECCGVIRR